MLMPWLTAAYRAVKQWVHKDPVQLVDWGERDGVLFSAGYISIHRPEKEHLTHCVH